MRTRPKEITTTRSGWIEKVGDRPVFREAWYMGHSNDPIPTAELRARGWKRVVRFLERRAARKIERRRPR